MADEVKPVKFCGVCKTGKLMPSGCGCDNATCHNYVEKWKLATPGYAPPKPVELPKPPVAVAPTAPAPVAAPTPTAEPEKKKRGRPKKNP